MPLSLRLPAEIENRLDILASLTGRSKTFYVVQAVLEHLDDLEDAHLAKEVLARVRAGKEKTLTLKELMAEYGLDR